MTSIIGKPKTKEKMRRYYISYLWIVLVILFAGCSDDMETTGTKVRVTISTSPRLYNDMTPAIKALDGYSPYSGAENPRMKVFFVNNSDNEQTQTVFNWQSGYTWSAEARLSIGNVYSTFGFMPSSAVTTATLTPAVDPSTGATMTLEGLSTAGTQDICVMAGVLKATELTPDITAKTNSDILGKWTFEATETGNVLYVLMHHLFAQVSLDFVVGSQYSTLRAIKLKKVTMTTKRGPVTATVTNNATSYADVAFILPATESTEIVTLYEDAEGKFISLEGETPTTIPAFFTPILSGSSREITFTSTYDVYDDTRSTIVRSNCTATNSWTLNTPLGSGEKYTINAKVKPTYLYQLADPDLDNPTIVLAAP